MADKAGDAEAMEAARTRFEQWRSSRSGNGTLRDMVCRGLLLMLERAGQITLPPVTYKRHNPRAQRSRPAPVLLDQTPIAAKLKDLGPIELEQTRRTADEPLFNSLMDEHHYLGYEQPVGEHLKYLVWAQGRPIACLAWSSAPRHLGSRDRYIGWSAEARRRNIRFLALARSSETLRIHERLQKVDRVAVHLLPVGADLRRHTAENVRSQMLHPHPGQNQKACVAGHGRNAASAFVGAPRIEIEHPNLKHGDRCPECGQGNVYVQREPRVLVRIVGQAPLAATV